MSLFCPNRRIFLKNTPKLLMGAAALSAFPKTAAARLLKGSANSTVQNWAPTIPSYATAWGFNTLRFFDDFLSSSTIDLNNSGNAGYNWYPKWFNFGSNNSFVVWPASGFMVAGSIMTWNPAVQSGVSTSDVAIGTSLFNGTNSYVNGYSTIPGAGFYIEARVMWGPGTGPASNLHGSFWTWDRDVWVYNNNGTPGTPYGSNRYTEIDVIEYPGTLTGDTQNYDYSSATTIGTNSGYITASTSPTAWNTYGVLWVPQALNSGTGLLKRYFNGVHLSSNDITYSSSTISAQAASGATTGWMSGLDASTLGQSLILQTGYGWPLNIDYVYVAQA